MKRAANKATRPSNTLNAQINAAKNKLLDIDKMLNGDNLKGEIGERSNPNASNGTGLGWFGFSNTYGPTTEHKGLLNRVKSQLTKVKSDLKQITTATLPQLEAALKSAGAPWIEGQGLIEN